MFSRSIPNHSSRLISQAGASLMELLVALVVSVLVIGVSANLYLKTRKTQDSIEKSISIKEADIAAMRIFSRAIKSAGYYPTFAQSTSVFPDSYPPEVRINSTVPNWIASSPSYLFPVFGCDSAQFNVVTGLCDPSSPATSKTDSIVLNSFTSDEVSLGEIVGSRLDCLGKDVALDPSNAPRANQTDLKARPLAPLFSSARYTLIPSTQWSGGASVASMALACHGNGAGVDASYQTIVNGLEELRFNYGVFDTADSKALSRYLTAADVNNLPAIEIDGINYAQWNRVIAVRVCVLVKSANSGVKQKSTTEISNGQTYLDCKGNTLTTQDGFARRRVIQTFAMRNRLVSEY